MSGYLYDDRDPTPVDWHQPMSCIIAKTITDFGEAVYVKFPDLDGGQHLHGPCRWMAQNAIDKPSAGDEALVVFDDRMRGWVLAWWGFPPLN